jgi:competence protein ComEC
MGRTEVEREGLMPPLFLVAVLWIAGLLVAHHWLVPTGVDSTSLAVLAPILLAASLLLRRDRMLVMICACALACILGALRYEAHVPKPDDPSLAAHYIDQGWSTLEGVVSEYPEVSDRWTRLTLNAERIELDGQVHEVRGKVLVRAPRFPEYHYGDRLRVSGWLQTPPVFEDFSYREYLARRGIHVLIQQPYIERTASGQGKPFRTAMYATKDHARDVIARLLPDPEASLLQGILLGIKTAIPDALYGDFNATGTSHIIVISGANLLIVAALFSRSFGRLLGKRRAYWFTMAGLVLYVLLVGADPVVTRAGVMAGLFVTARHLGRQSTAYVSLLASAVFLTLINPLALWGVGFQLSFAATLGLILFTAPIEGLFERGLTRFVSREQAQKGIRYLNDVLIVTLAAMILVIPLVIYHFGRLSLVAPIANLLILPVQAPIMITGGVATLTGLIPFLEPVARVIAWVPWLCLAYTSWVVSIMAAWPFASIQIGHTSAGWLLAYYVLLLGIAWTVSHREGSASRLWTWATSRASSKVILGLSLAAAILSWLAVLQLPDGRLHVAFLDVGQGDAILVTTPQGQQILIDGGPNPTALTSALGKQMPFWDRSIDLLLMTHPDGDHTTGLTAVLSRYTVGQWLDSGCVDNDPTYIECQRLLQATMVPRHSVRAGDQVELGEGLVLEVLHPPSELMTGTPSDSNNNSVVLRLVWKEASVLLTGDLEAEGEQLLLRSSQPLNANVLKIGHHGSAGASTPQFLSAVSPDLAVISVGADNDFGHPDQAVLERLAHQSNLTILRTDEQGTVEFTTDGHHLWVRTER